METTQAGAAKRRRLTRQEVQEPFEAQGPNSAKKEFADGVKVKKEKSAEQEAELAIPDKGGIDSDDLWLRVKKEIKEEMEPDLRPSSFDAATLAQEVGVKEEIEEEQHQDLTGYPSEATQEDRIPEESSKFGIGQSAAKSAPKPVVKRRRLTRRDMQEPVEAQGPNAAKKEFADGVKVKKEKSAEQEAELAIPDKGGIDSDDLWLRVKKEIKEEMEPDLRPSSFDAATLAQEVGVKEEIEEEQHQDLTGYPSEATQEDRIPEESSKFGIGQSAAKSGPKPVVKRRRLARRDMREHSSKKEPPAGVKVKKEKSAEQEAECEIPHKGGVDSDDLWLLVREEIKKHPLESTASGPASGDATSASQRDSSASGVPSSSQKEEPSEEADKWEGYADDFWVKHAHAPKCNSVADRYCIILYIRFITRTAWLNMFYHVLMLTNLF